jgi:hypothetical protein
MSSRFCEPSMEATFNLTPASPCGPDRADTVRDR